MIFSSLTFLYAYLPLTLALVDDEDMKNRCHALAEA